MLPVMENASETFTVVGCAQRSSLVCYIRIVEARDSTPLCSMQKPRSLLLTGFLFLRKGGSLMLRIVFGNYEAANYIPTPDPYFDNTYEEEWLEDELSKRMVLDVDKSTLIGPYLVQSPVLGSIPVTRLSGSVKTLIMIAHDPEHVYNASACGDNCAKWLLELGQERDILIRLGYLMDFGKAPLEIEIVNLGKSVHSMKELVNIVVMNDLLRN